MDEFYQKDSLGSRLRPFSPIKKGKAERHIALQPALITALECGFVCSPIIILLSLLFSHLSVYYHSHFQ
jgi:hypothetical protein